MFEQHVPHRQPFVHRGLEPAKVHGYMFFKKLVWYTL